MCLKSCFIFLWVLAEILTIVKHKFQSFNIIKTYFEKKKRKFCTLFKKLYSFIPNLNYEMNQLVKISSKVNRKGSYGVTEYVYIRKDLCTKSICDEINIKGPKIFFSCMFLFL